MNSSNGFTGAQFSTGMLGSDNATIMSGTVLHQSLTGVAGTPTSTVVPGLSISTVMQSIGLHQPLNGNGVAQASSGVSGVDIGTMMGGLIQDVLAGNDSNSGIAPNVAQTMLDIMDDMPGVHLVGLAPMGLDYFTVQA
ncbi:MAG: hypothetical protein D4S02_12370 [Rhodocyclaceae bacterium]|nr:MAG: hypothetical protein D4S02_12370 [Rhodocyclaceae bacterium]